VFIPVAYVGALAGVLTFVSAAGKLGKHADKLNEENARSVHDESRHNAA
jgi:hypothetical protein